MVNPERKIYVPLGDKNRPDLEKAAFDEAWNLNHEIIENEYSKGRIVVGIVEPLQNFLLSIPFTILKKELLPWVVTLFQSKKEKCFGRILEIKPPFKFVIFN